MDKTKLMAIIGALLALALVQPVLASEYGRVMYNTTEQVSIIVACEKIDGTPCGSSVSCNLTTYYPNSTFNNYTQMSYFNLGFFNKTLGQVPFIGVNPAIANCTDGTYNGTVDASFEIKYITTPDPYPPVLNWSNPSSGGSNNYDGSFTLNLTANFTDPNGIVTSAYLEWDSVNQTAFNTTNSWYSSVSPITSGSHTFRWWMHDSNDTWAVSSSFTYNVYSNTGSSSAGSSYSSVTINNYNQTNLTVPTVPTGVDSATIRKQIDDSNQKTQFYIGVLVLFLAILILATNQDSLQKIGDSLKREFG